MVNSGNFFFSSFSFSSVHSKPPATPSTSPPRNNNKRSGVWSSTPTISTIIPSSVDTAICRRNGGSVRFQGLSQGRGWCSFREARQHRIGREGTLGFGQGGDLRLSGRMRIRTQRGSRWQTHQWRKGTRCRHECTGHYQRRQRRGQRRTNGIIRAPSLTTKTTILTIMMLTTMLLLDRCSFRYGVMALGDLSTLAFVSSRHVACLGGGGDVVRFRQRNADGRILERRSHDSIFSLGRNRNKGGLSPYKGAVFGCGLYKVRPPIVQKMAMMEEEDDYQDDREAENEAEEHNDAEGEDKDNEDNGGGGGGNIGEGELDSPSVVLKDLSWRVEKLRLEEANTRRFLKSGPRFLPYEECRKWVQAWSRWDTEQDWKDWINEGEKRNSYIPARPDEYYGRLGVWRGWDHFLGNICDEEDHDDVDDGNIGDVSDDMGSSTHFE